MPSKNQTLSSIGSLFDLRWRCALRPVAFSRVKWAMEMTVWVREDPKKT